MNRAGEPQRAVWVDQVMGTAISVHVLTRPGAPDLGDAVAGCFAELHDMDRLFSTYRRNSDISRLRRREAGISDLDPHIAEVVVACDEWERATRGRFAANRQGWFDPTGYVKGWSVETAARRHLAPLLERSGVVAAGINAGGDLQLFTADDADWCWHVGIADPARPGEVIATLGITTGAVATSGTAERGHHIVDPRTGMPAREVVSATVVADGLAAADVWATTAVVAGIDDLSWIADAATRSGVVIGAAGGIRRWLGTTEVSVQAAETHP
ncbi:FAD:protein FMN transferase [Microbacterium deminutum]|uniref:FAD:protein FMN transferase n=1 Tax=Microbacterium deminutum TaxID=344164 RepID=A0ABN2RCH3_9MICO